MNFQYISNCVIQGSEQWTACLRWSGKSGYEKSITVLLLIDEVHTEISIQPIPLLVFEHLRLYEQKHLNQSAAVFDSLLYYLKGRSLQTKSTKVKILII